MTEGQSTKTDREFLSGPSYLSLFESGRFKGLLGRLEELMADCSLCPRNCGVNRIKGETGYCRTAAAPVISSHGPHFGEERVLVGRRGSGTIFFTHCNLRCIFCQNYDISQLGRGRETGFSELAEIMLSLQETGCHNINFVSPTHQVYQVLRALELAVPRGLRLPLVYNSGGYDSAPVLRLLDGLFDIYMPDFKYSDPATAARLSDAPDYPERAREAVSEMFRQVGDLVIGPDGVARRGLLVRHLVLPEDLAGTEGVVEFLEKLSPNTYLNLMDQYRPEFRAGEEPRLDRPLTAGEFSRARAIARSRLPRGE